MKLILLGIILIAFATAAAAQNTIKLFDPTAIGTSDDNIIMNSSPFGMYKSVQVYLSCPTSGSLTSSISGPNGSNLIIDNSLLVNGGDVCLGNCFSTVSDDPIGYLGQPVEAAYLGIPPVNVSSTITSSGLYTFDLLDFGYTYGNSAVYLNTSCSIIPVNTPTGDSVICHRNSGNRGPQTLTVGSAAVAAHLRHGDTLGACAQ